MRLNNDLIDLEIDGNIESSGSAKIAEEDIAMAFSIVSEGFYSDIYGSIVRELTSNCVDSHIEANCEDKAVEIKFSNEEGTDFISFIDKGMGMSQEFFENVFMSYFKSTKRESNAYYGAFGIGSKSPLGYQDSYEIITTKEGLTSHYLISRAVSGPPNFDLLVQKEDLFASNGTEVRMVVNEGDIPKFEKAIQEQLQYFDNVIVTGIYFNNIYHILETDTFKYRVDNLGDSEGLDKLHIAVGRVSYPIDFKRLGIEEISCPIGVKFEIGELIVTKNRESLRYDSEECNSLIKERIEAALQNLGEIYNKQNTESLTLEEYIKHLKSPDKYIHLGKVGSLNWDVKIRLPYKYVRGPRGGEKKEYLIKGLSDPIYLPLQGYNLKIPDNPFFIFEIKKWFNDTNKKNFNITNNIWNLIVNPIHSKRFVRYNKRDEEDIRKNKYIFWELSKNVNYLEAVGLVRLRETNTKKDKEELWSDYNILLGLNDEESIRNNNDTQRFYNRTFNRSIASSVPNIQNGLNKTQRIKAYKKAMIKEIVDRTPAYRKFEISKEYLEYRKSLRAKRTILETNEFKITSLSGGDEVVTSKKILKDTRLVVYGFRGNTTKLRTVEILLEMSRIGKNSPKSRRFYNNTFDLHIIPKKALPYYEANKQFYSMEEFLTNGNKAFRRALTTYKVIVEMEEIKEYTYLIQMLPTLRVDIHDLVSKITNRMSFSERRIFDRLKDNNMEEFRNGCIEIMDNNNWWISEDMEMLALIKEWFSELDMLKYIEASARKDNIATKQLIEYLKFKKKKLDAVHYFKVRETEDFIIKFFLKRIEDLNRLNEDIDKSRVFIPKQIQYLNVYNHGS